MAAVTICSDPGAQKIKSDTVSTVSLSISHEVTGPDAQYPSVNTDVEDTVKNKIPSSQGI